MGILLLEFAYSPKRSPLESCPGFNEAVFSEAAAGGQIRALQWSSNTSKCPWNGSACVSAARSGRENVVRWLRTNGCPWDGRVCAWAAKSGHLSILQTLILTGAQWVQEQLRGLLGQDGLTLLRMQLAAVALSVKAHATGRPGKETSAC